MLRSAFPSAMGFPVGYPEIIVPKLVLKVAYVLGFIRTAVYCFLGLFGSGEFLETETSWPHEANPWPHEANPRLEPVRSSVSAQRIRERLPVLKFGVLVEEAEDEDVDVVCAVCLNDMERHEEIRRLMNCSHIFHRGCLDKWLDHGQKTCPLCRSPFLLDDIETELEEELRMLEHSSTLFGNFSAVLSQ